MLMSSWWCHPLTVQDEKQRIEDLGGCITFMGCWRVNGTYAVSRAIGEWSHDLQCCLWDGQLTIQTHSPTGDFDQKPYVSGDADCTTTQLFGDEDYVLLACDGFFDAVRPSMVPELVLNALQQPIDPEGGVGASLNQTEEEVGPRVAQHLVGYAKAAGSSDNITVMVVFLRPLEQLLAPDSMTGTAQATQDSISPDALQQWRRLYYCQHFSACPVFVFRFC